MFSSRFLAVRDHSAFFLASLPRFFVYHCSQPLTSPPPSLPSFPCFMWITSRLTLFNPAALHLLLGFFSFFFYPDPFSWFFFPNSSHVFCGAQSPLTYFFFENCGKTSLYFASGIVNLYFVTQFIFLLHTSSSLHLLSH